MNSSNTRPSPTDDADGVPVRSFATSIPGEVLSAIQQGTLRSEYRGISFRKDPLDMALYTRLVFELQPRTVIEIGALAGGSALWFADLLTIYGIDGHVYSVDRSIPADVRDPRITFVRGDATALDVALPVSLVSSLPGPLLVVEDSAHTYQATLAVLTFFHRFLKPGDYIVVEDGIVNDMPGDRYREYDNGPNRALSAFLQRHPASYEIDVAYCDFFGYNATFNPNGYLKRVA